MELQLTEFIMATPTIIEPTVEKGKGDNSSIIKKCLMTALLDFWTTGQAGAHYGDYSEVILCEVCAGSQAGAWEPAVDQELFSFFSLSLR